MKKENIAKTLKVLKKYQTGSSMLVKMSKSTNAFKSLICTILSARARDEVTYPLCNQLFRKYKNSKQLAAAKQKDVEKIIKSIGFYRNKSKNVIATAKIIQKDHKGRVPKEKSELLMLPGVGSKVANCVLAYVFGKPAIAVDTHVHRISNRLGWVKTNTPKKTEDALEKIVPKKYWIVVNDVLVVHGQSICAPITPKCSKCPIRKFCRRIGVKKFT